MDCDYVVRGETEDEVMRNGSEHARRDHGMTDEQMKEPALVQKIKSLIHDA